MMRRAPVIAIDGPAASGKGTIAQGVAAALGFHYLDSGSLYRLVALQGARDTGVPLDDEPRLAAHRRRRSTRASATGILLDGERR